MFDIGVGICAAMDRESVTVRLDSAMVSRLAPELPWRRSGTSMLRLPIAACSRRKPPEVGSETYLRGESLKKSVEAALDLEGDGRFVRVDLMALAPRVDVDTAPDPNPKPRARSHKAR